MKGDTRCIDGRLMRHDPQFDDPYLETDIGKCPECDGEGTCEGCRQAETIFEEDEHEARRADGQFGVGA